MSTFEYTAIDPINAIHRGRVRSFSKRGAAKIVERSGLAVVTLVRDQQPSALLDLFHRRVTRMDRIVFTRNLLTMLRAGMQLAEALAASREQTANPELRRILAGAEARVLAGQQLSTSLAQHPTIFPPVFTAMMHIGERGGKLTEVLTLLAQQQESDLRLLRRIQSALVYPAILFATMVGIVALMVVFVIPKIAAIYQEAGVALPFFTAALVAVSDFTARYGLYALAALLLLGFVLKRELRHAPRLRRAVHRALLRLPAVGLIMKKAHLAVISRTLSMLARAGISIDEALQLASRVSDNILYQEAIERAVPFVKRGVRLTDIFRGDNHLFLPIFQKMVATGEETGNLDDLFGHVADYYDEEVSHWTANASSFIEPILLLATGLVVGGIAFAILFPLWNFANIL